MEGEGAGEGVPTWRPAPTEGVGEAGEPGRPRPRPRLVTLVKLPSRALPEGGLDGSTNGELSFDCLPCLQVLSRCCLSFCSTVVCCLLLSRDSCVVLFEEEDATHTLLPSLLFHNPTSLDFTLPFPFPATLPSPLSLRTCKALICSLTTHSVARVIRSNATPLATPRATRASTNTLGATCAQ